MFVISTPEQSEALLGELVDLELSLFTDLGLHFKVLDMPTADLGAPAYRKIDFEVNVYPPALHACAYSQPRTHYGRAKRPKGRITSALHRSCIICRQ